MKTIGRTHIALTNIEYSEKIAVIDEVCSLLDDGKWHTINEVGKEVGLSSTFLGSVLSFLRKYQLVKISMKSEGKVRMKKGTPRLKPAVYILKALLDAERAKATRREAHESRKCMVAVTACTGRRSS
jgi:hypothetical protein